MTIWEKCETRKSRNRTIDEDLKDADYPYNRIKKWDHWEDFEDLLSNRIPHTNCRPKDKSPSYFHAGAWLEKWDYKLAHNFKSPFGPIPQVT